MRYEILDTENQRFKVYHAEKMEPYFEERKGMPSARMFSTNWGANGIRGLKLIEEEHNCSWYKNIRERWETEKRWDIEMVFYRGRTWTARETFAMADKVAAALVAAGVEKGDEIGCCLANTPEVIFLMLGANRIGAKLNFFGEFYDKTFISIILKDCTDKIFFASDESYDEIEELIKNTPIKNKILISLADSLPENPEEMPEYEKKFDKYYRYENKAATYIARNDDLTSFADFVAAGEGHEDEVHDTSDLDTEFLVTYTSGSTKVGFPKREIHRNRSLITVGVFHDPDLCGNPNVWHLRGLAHLHTDTDTNLITMISDSFFQGWSVAMEPEYGTEIFVDYLFIDKPNFVLATTGFLLATARKYLVDKHCGIRKMPFLLVVMAVGEPCSPGEERFINTWLKKSKAGSKVNLVGKLRLPWTTVGIGGGDTEHGGIYYTLFKRMNEVLKKPQLKGESLGMMPVPYVQCAVLKENENGEYEEVGYNEYGVIVANSATTMAGYKDFEKTKEKVITDNKGMDWVSCDVFGYIDKFGAVHMKDRRDSEVVLEDGRRVLPFELVDCAQKDTENLMTTVVVTAEKDGKTYFIINVEYSPLRKNHKDEILASLDKRIKKEFPDIYDRILYRKFNSKKPFPVNPSGKRNVVGVTNMGLEDAVLYKDGKLVPVE